MVHRFDARQQRWVNDAKGGGAAEAVRRRRTERTTIAVSAAVLLACSLGFGLWQSSGNGSGGSPVGETEAPTSTPEPWESAPDPWESSGTYGPTDVPDPWETYGQGVAPSGYERVEDDVGWTVDVPEGWERKAQEWEDRATVVNYESPDGDRRLQIFWVEDDSPYASVRLADEELQGGVPEYQQMSLHALPGGAARLEYSYAGESGEKRHVVDHRFKAADGEYYAVAASGPAGDDPDQEEAPVAAALASFCPGGGECPA